MSRELSTSTQSNSLPDSWMKSLFKKLGLSYGTQFTDKWKGQNIADVMAHWGEQLGSFTPAELKRGYEAIDGHTFPPSLPEFKVMCRPPIDPVEAYYGAVAGLQQRAAGEVGVWSHPAIFWASVTMSSDLLSQTYAQIKPRWEVALKEQLAKTEWAEIHKPRLALPPPSPSDAAVAKKVMNDIGAGQLTRKRNLDTSWIDKIFDREKKKDPTLTCGVIKMARDAADAIGYQHK